MLLVPTLRGETNTAQYPPSILRGAVLSVSLPVSSCSSLLFFPHKFPTLCFLFWVCLGRTEKSAFFSVILGSNVITGAREVWSQARLGSGAVFCYSPFCDGWNGLLWCAVNHLRRIFSFRWSKHSRGLSTGHCKGTCWSFISCLWNKNIEALLFPPPFWKADPMIMLYLHYTSVSHCIWLCLSLAKKNSIVWWCYFMVNYGFCCYGICCFIYF